MGNFEKIGRVFAVFILSLLPHIPFHGVAAKTPLQHRGGGIAIPFPIPFPSTLRVDTDELGEIDLSWRIIDSLIYDDGEFDIFLNRHPGANWAVRMGGCEGVQRHVENVSIFVIAPDTLTICGWEDTGPYVEGRRMPGEAPLYTLSGIVPNDSAWTVVDVSDLNWAFDGNFYLGCVSEDLYSSRFGMDTDLVDDHRSVIFQPGWDWMTWTAIADSLQLPHADFALRATLVPLEKIVGFRLHRGLHSGDYQSVLTSTTETTYHDGAVELGTTYYYVATALHSSEGDTVESHPSNEVSITSWAWGVFDISYDDGTPEDFFPLCPGCNGAVRFRSPVYPAAIHKVRYYVASAESGSSVAMIWDDDGPSGEPFTELYSARIDGAVEGWNYHLLEPEPILIEDGGFYAGWEVLDDTLPVGIDHDFPDQRRSWFRTPFGDWESFSRGDLMIRALVRYDEGVGGELQPAKTPQQCALGFNYPNPFNATTVIHYHLPSSGQGDTRTWRWGARVLLRVYNVAGQVVRTLVDEEQLSGHHRAFWNGRDDRGEEVASGIYLYRLQAGEYVMTRRMVLLR